MFNASFLLQFQEMVTSRSSGSIGTQTQTRTREETDQDATQLTLATIKTQTAVNREETDQRFRKSPYLAFGG